MVIRDKMTLGRGYWSKNMNTKRQPASLYAEDSAYIKIYPDWDGNENSPRYLYDQGYNVKIPLRNDEIVCFLYGKSTYRYSLSPVQILRNTILSDIEATESASRIVRMKPPPHLVQIPGASEQQIQTLRALYDSTLAGRNEIFFMGGNGQASVHPLVYSLKDQQWMEWLEYLARKIAVIFGLSLQMFSFVGDVNRATASVQQELQDNKGLIPQMLSIEETLNRSLLADFAPKLPNGRANIDALNLRIVFPEISEAARQMHAQQAVDMATKSLAGLPSQTINQVLLSMGAEPLPHGGNTLYLASMNGAIPWLSYDGDFPDWTPSLGGGELGAQDASGGPQDNEDVTEDPGNTNDTTDNSSSTTGQSTDNGGGSPTATPTETPTSSPADAGNAGATGAESATKGFEYKDYRRPGSLWTPGTTLIRRSASMAVAPETTKAAKKSNASSQKIDDEAARAQLAAAVQRVFGEVQRRGDETIKGMQG
jgi:hypothetical protein